MSTPIRRVRRTFDPSAEALGLGYARYSTDGQGSTAEQIAINMELAFEEDVRIVETFKDEGISRSLSDRPGLRAMFAYLAEHPEIRYIVVNELERLTAGIEQRAEVTRLCKRSGITILTEDMGRIDPHDEEKMFEADQRAVSSKGEVLKVRRRTRRNLRAKVRAGTVAMRPAYGVRMKPLLGADGEELPSGTRVVDAQGKRITSGKIELHPDEYPWLQQIFNWADEGKSSDWIAAELSARGVPTKSGRAEWRGNTINGILDNPFYKGVRIWGHQATVRDENEKPYLEVRDEDDPHRLTLESPLGAIIPVEQWDRIHERRVSRRNERSRSRTKYERQPFDEFVYCGRCGHRMYGRNDQGSRGFSWRYFCYSKRIGYDEQKEGFQRCDMAHSMSMKNILKTLAGQRIKGVRGNQVSVVQEGRQVVDVDLQRRRLLKEIEDAEAAYKNAKRLAIKGLIDEDDLTEAQAELRSVTADRQERIAKLDDAGTTTLVPWKGEIQAAWALLAEQVADESVPVDLRVELLRRAGLERLYVDAPALRLHLVQ